MDQIFFLTGSVLLIVMTLIVVLNFSKDSKLFAKELKPAAMAAATQLPAHESPNDDYGTFKYNRDGYGTGNEEKEKNTEARIEIINCSGNEKLPESVKDTLKNAGFRNIVIEKIQSRGNNGEREQNKQNTTKPGLLHTPVNTEGITPLTTPQHTGKVLPENTQEVISTQDATSLSGSTPMPSPTESLEENDPRQPESGSDDGDKKNTVNETQIIERNEKGFGAEIKKVIKVGKVVKKLDSKYLYDVTIILGNDFNP